MRAVVDAGLQDEAWCRDHTTGYDALLERLAERPVEGWAALCGVDPGVVRAVAEDFATTAPALLRLGVGAQRHRGAPAAYATAACLPALTGAWRHAGGGCSYVPTATAAAVSAGRLRRDDLRPGPVRSINMARLGRALTDPALDPPVAALVCWNANPAQIAPDQTQVLRGLARDDLFTVVVEQFPTDTVAHADVVLPATTAMEHLDVVFSWGHHYVTFNEPAIAPLGEAAPNTEVFRRIAARLGLTDPCFTDSDEELARQLLAGEPGGIALDELRRRGFAKVDLGQGDAPHAAGGFGTADGRVQLGAAAYEPAAEVADAALAGRYGLALLTPKTHLFLNTTFANGRRQLGAQPAPVVVLHPDDARTRGIADGERVRVFNDRGAFACTVSVSGDTRPGVAVAPMGWWRAHHGGGPSAQATTSQRLTPAGDAPTFNDNRVEVERAPVAEPGP
jgi:anaerobic selenocysteine-containing dehydrogenase